MHETQPPKTARPMWPLAEGLDLSFLVGREVIQISIGVYQSQISFDRDTTLSMESRCRFAGREYAAGVGSAPVLLPLLGQRVERVEVRAREVCLHFVGGYEVSVLEGNDGYESFSISTPEATFVV